MNMNITSLKPGVEKQLFKLKAPQRDGLILQVHNTPTQATMQQRIRYTQATFDPMGFLMIAVNQKGDILVVDFVNNKFWTIPSFHLCTVLKFSPLNDCEVLMGGLNGIIHIINIETGETVGLLNSHKYSISGLSFSKDYYCLSSSNCEAILWNLRTNLEIQNLNLAENTLLKLICFLPITNNILACFQDDTMQVWTYENFESYRKILPSSWNKSSVKCIAITRNGRAMVVGGTASYLAIFLLDIWEYTKTVKLPNYIQSVKNLDFISEPFDGGSNRILAILSGNGILYFYNMETFSVMNKLVTVQEIIKFNVSSDGKYLASILSTGEINLYALNQYLMNSGSVDIVKSKPKKKLTKPDASQLRKMSGDCNVYKEIKEILDLEKLQKILKHFGAFPDVHRLKIWAQLLQLPNNYEGFKAININPVKSPFDNIDADYPLENKIALKNLKRALINLCTWSPFFANVDYLPVFVFPFIRVFQNEPTLCFEALCTIILNWCQHWYEYFPMPPINVLAILENVMLEHDTKLLRHLSQNYVTSEIYAWSLLEAAFSESLSSENWRIIWDHILTNEPAFLLLAPIAYNLINRSTLLSLNGLENFEFFYHNQNPVDMNKVIAKTYYLLEQTSEKNHPRQYLNTFRSIAGESYPMFADFPKAILDCTEKELDHLSLEEDALKLEVEDIRKSWNRNNEEFNKIKNNEIEYQRIQELESKCKNKVREECERIQKERQRIVSLRKQLIEEETVLKSLNSRTVMATSIRDKQEALEKVLNQIEENRAKDELDVLNTETELLRHYSDLLKNRIQIENMFTTKPPKETAAEQVKIHQKILLEEISKIQGLIDSRKYLKELSVATGLAAMDSLIQRVEKELLKPASPKNGKYNYATKVSKLQAESLDLELRVQELLRLLEEHKKMTANKSAQKVESLEDVEEIVLDITDINSAYNFDSKTDINNKVNFLGRPSSVTIL